MAIRINGATISEEAIGAEMRHHGEASAPRDAAACALAIRELLLQRASALGLDGGSDDDVIDALLAREVRTPEPTEAECLRHYTSHQGQFRSGDLVEASHILFAVTPSAPLAAIRAQAETALKHLVADPGLFEELAAKCSNCPSGAQGGNLGQLGRGDTVPEFDAELFGGTATGVLPRLVRTRHGFHIVRVARRIEGRQVPFELARERIAGYLVESVRRKAVQQYLRVLAAEAQIEGIDIGAAGSPLLQ